MKTRELLEGTMRVLQAALAATLLLGLGIASNCWGLAQTSAQPAAAASAPTQEPAAPSSSASDPASAPAVTPSSVPPPDAVPAVATKKTYTVPAGTKVLLQLRSSVNTKSAKPGDGVYLASTFPVVVGTRVMIPAGVYVQGVVDRVVRAGRVKGRSQLDMHFTSIIFPNGTVVEIPGLVNSLPGASKQTVKDDGEGTVEQAGDKGRNAGTVAKIAIPTGGSVGSIGGYGSGHPIAGGVIGIGAGLAATGLATLFTRGADVNIESGAQVEMVLQRPLLLEDENLGGASAPGTGSALVPAANQPKPMEKPGRTRVLCPLGGLGCE
jgi:type IV secretion system protein VirB10